MSVKFEQGREPIADSNKKRDNPCGPVDREIRVAVRVLDRQESRHNERTDRYDRPCSMKADGNTPCLHLQFEGQAIVAFQDDLLLLWCQINIIYNRLKGGYLSTLATEHD